MARHILFGDFGKEIAKHFEDQSSHVVQQIAAALIARYDGDEDKLDRALGEVLNDALDIR